MRRSDAAKRRPHAGQRIGGPEVEVSLSACCIAKRTLERPSEEPQNLQPKRFDLVAPDGAMEA